MNRTRLRKALNEIAAGDQDVARALRYLGYPEPRKRPAGFATFLETIVSQQLSARVAATIMGRVRVLLPEMTPEALLALSDGALRGAGLSGRKVEYAVGLARAITAGEFAPEAFDALEDEAVIESIVALRGFGRWSAEIYLMFSLGRPDVFPADDLALQVALQRLKTLKMRPTAAAARRLVAHWAPWRSAGSLLLWHYHHGMPLEG